MFWLSVCRKWDSWSTLVWSTFVHKANLPTLCVSGLCLHWIPLVWCAGIQNVHSSKLFDVSLEYNICSFNMNQGIHSASLNQWKTYTFIFLWQHLHPPPPSPSIHTHTQAQMTPPNSATKDSSAGGPTTRSSSRKRTRPSPYDRPNKSTRTTRNMMEVRKRAR